MAYICLYKKVNDWKNIENVHDLLKLHLPGVQPNQIAIKNVIMKNQIFQDRQEMNMVNRLRSAESMSDVRGQNHSPEMAQEADRPMFEGSPRQSFEDSPDGDQDQTSSSFNIFKPKKQTSRSVTPRNKNDNKI